MPLPTIQTTIFLSLFLVFYLLILLKNAIINKIDLYDLFLLSAVGVIPAFFIYFPDLTSRLAVFVGVKFPFLLIFGSLFFIVFIYLIRLVIKMNHMAKMNILLTQEVGLLKQEFEDYKKQFK
jgi:hypothetical protein